MSDISREEVVKLFKQYLDKSISLSLYDKEIFEKALSFAITLIEQGTNQEADIKLLELYLKNTRNDVKNLQKQNKELLETLKGLESRATYNEEKTTVFKKAKQAIQNAENK